MSTTIPTADQLRADIRARTAELRAKRRLLRLAEAAEAALAAQRERESLIGRCARPGPEREAARA